VACPAIVGFSPSPPEHQLLGIIFQNKGGKFWDNMVFCAGNIGFCSGYFAKTWCIMVRAKNLRCQIVLQYMTENDNPNLRDGTDQTSAGGDDDDPTEEETAEESRGYHELYDFYQTCTLDALDVLGHHC
jgi:hypothetical protein